jgi:predicted ester cyclase
MSEQENIKLATVFFEAWNAGDLSPSMRVQSDSYRSEAPGAPAPLDRDQTLAYNQNFLTAFPGSKFEVLLTVAQGDYVVIHWRATGKNNGPLRSPSGAVIPPTGKAATLVGSTTAQIMNGKIIHSWNFWDMSSLLGQMGLLPPM